MLYTTSCKVHVMVMVTKSRLFQLFSVVLWSVFQWNICHAEISALDGFGKPVAWWAILKLPSKIRIGNSTKSIPTPCNCQAPSCDNVRYKADAKQPTSKSSGLCYLYADANNPSFQYFESLGYECLGQGGNDPLSQTLRQMYQQNKSSSDDIKWAMFNDQLDAIAQGEDSRNECNGGEKFSAHSKGAFAYEESSGGFFLQTSTPNFPDPSATIPGKDSFISLGCQLRDNTRYAQHLFAFSVETKEMKTLASSLLNARFCSANAHDVLRDLIASKSLLNGTAGDPVYDAFIERNPSKLPPSPPSPSSVLTVPLKNSKESIQVLVKSPKTNILPWALVAESMKSDYSVATWMDAAFGVPSICAGDDFSITKEYFCIGNDTSSSASSSSIAKYNVENLLEAQWTVPVNTGEGTEETLQWRLIGGTSSDMNHGKWGVSTPRVGEITEKTLVTFGDLNMQGFPCSSGCSASQSGRGGAFYTVSSGSLHQSIVKSLVTNACSCKASSSPFKDRKEEYKQVRMCGRGCQKYIDRNWNPQDLPQLSTNPSSFWKD